MHSTEIVVDQYPSNQVVKRESRLRDIVGIDHRWRTRSTKSRFLATPYLLHEKLFENFADKAMYSASKLLVTAHPGSEQNQISRSIDRQAHTTANRNPTSTQSVRHIHQPYHQTPKPQPRTHLTAQADKTQHQDDSDNTPEPTQTHTSHTTPSHSSYCATYPAKPLYTPTPSLGR